MNRPCDNCPFRNDRPFPLLEERAHAIADSLYAGAMFPCHKTVDYSDGDDGSTTADSKFCGGALIVMEKEFEQGAVENQMARLSARMGWLDLAALDMDAPVYDSFDEWIDAKVDEDAQGR